MAPTTAWADTPFRLITETGVGIEEKTDLHPNKMAVFYARQMALIHNTLIRALNASYNQCLGVAPNTQDATDFLIYNQCIYEFLHEHHTVEEDVFFRDLEGLTDIKGLMEGNTNQHKDFEAGMERYKEYVFNTKREDYDGKALKDILDSFGKVLEQHWHDEIPTLLELSKYDEGAMMKIWKRAEYAATHFVDQYRNAPLVFGCQDRTFVIDGENRPFPSAPSFVPYIVQYWYSRRYAGVWRFNPCTIFKEPRPLQFTPQ